MVIFGAAGDLTGRMLIPSLYNLARAQLLSPEFAVVGVARSQMSDEEFRKRQRETAWRSPLFKNLAEVAADTAAEDARPGLRQQFLTMVEQSGVGVSAERLLGIMAVVAVALGGLGVLVRRNLLVAGIDRERDLLRAAAHSRRESARGLETDVAWRRRKEHEADHIGPGRERRVQCLGCLQAADFDQQGHGWERSINWISRLVATVRGSKSNSIVSATTWKSICQ